MMDWFTREFGFKEVTGMNYMKTRESFALEGDRLISSGKKGRPYIAGSFENPSLEELRQRARSLSVPPGLKTGKLTVKEVVGDVSELHTLTENAYALFQAASQFNCLEHTSERGVPEDGITIYAHDRTQGPACAIACAPGTIMRNYFALGGEPQSASKQVLNLKEVEELLNNDKHKYFTVKSGYTMATTGSLSQLSKVMQDRDISEKVQAKLRIGIQADTEVTSSGFGRRPYTGPQQLVTQVYGSAISVSYSRCTAASWEAFAREILNASYEATMIAALENAVRNDKQPGSKRVFLTALGGGVFGNDMQWVHDAMQAAFDKYKDYGLEVFLVSYGSSERKFKELEKRYPA